MAGIDSSIYLQQQAPSIFGSYVKGNEQGMRMAQLSREKKDAEDEQAFKDSVKGAYVQDPKTGQLTLDQAKMSEIAKADPMRAQAYIQQHQQAQLEHMTNASKYAVGVLGGVGDQKTWELAKPRLIASGAYHPGEIPDQYDPSWVKKQSEIGQTAIQKADLQLKLAEVAKNRAEEKKLLAEANNKSGSEGKTEGVKELDRSYAKDYNEWTSQGRAALDKNLMRLENAKKALQQDPSLTGGFVGMVPDKIRNITNEKAITTRDDVRAAAQGALKAVLGAQFTEKEGERIMNQAYNESLSPEANIAKIDAALNELRVAKANQDAKAQYFQQRGTLAGFTPQSVQMAQGQGAPQSAAPVAAAQPHPQDNAAIQWAQQNPNDPRAAKILEANGVTARASR